ncbi:MAG: GlsB/YeaQ/YmgE family stress response membrane protein [Roseburia sp.]
MEQKTDVFEYTYSAKEQEEVEKIRRKYMPKEEDKMEKLRKLDRQVGRKGTIVSLALGIVGALILGTGMSMSLVWTDFLLVPGILIGIIGMVVLGAAYPVYRKLVEKEKERLAPQILALTEELSNQ